jgi:hypothetical protein
VVFRAVPRASGGCQRGRGRRVRPGHRRSAESVVVVPAAQAGDSFRVGQVWRQVILWKSSWGSGGGHLLWALRAVWVTVGLGNWDTCWLSTPELSKCP